MKRHVRRTRSVTALATLTLAAMSAAAPVASASGSGVPFNDTSIHGTLTFCSRSGVAMTSGSLFTAPFAWKTVSSTPAPRGYRNTTARATLYAYQPIQFVDPGDWSGQQLTGASSFTNAAHPVVQATNLDSALLGFSNAYPAHWDGTVELRMYYTAFNRGVHSQSYPAAVLRIKGSTWTMLSGGGSSCNAGSGVSDETKLLPKKKLKKEHSAVPVGSATPVAATSSSAANGSSSKSSGGSTNGAAKTGASTASDSSGLSSGAKGGIGLGIVAVLTIGGTAAMWWRRRVSGPS